MYEISQRHAQKGLLLVCMYSYGFTWLPLGVIKKQQRSASYCITTLLHIASRMIPNAVDAGSGSPQAPLVPSSECAKLSYPTCNSPITISSLIIVANVIKRSASLAGFCRWWSAQPCRILGLGLWASHIHHMHTNSQAKSGLIQDRTLTTQAFLVFRLLFRRALPGYGFVTLSVWAGVHLVHSYI